MFKNAVYVPVMHLVTIHMFLEAKAIDPLH